MLMFVSFLFLIGAMGCGNTQHPKGFILCDKVVDKDMRAVLSAADMINNADNYWEFEENGTGKYDEPLTKISIIIDDKEYLVAEKILGSAWEISQDEWELRNIPKTAKTACMAWWAGSGDVFYMENSNGVYSIWHAEIWEEMTDADIEYVKVREVNEKK